MAECRKKEGSLLTIAFSSYPSRLAPDSYLVLNLTSMQLSAPSPGFRKKLIIKQFIILVPATLL